MLMSIGVIESCEPHQGVHKVNLVVGAIGLGLRQALGDGKVLKVGLARLLALSQRAVEVADLVV